MLLIRDKLYFTLQKSLPRQLFFMVLFFRVFRRASEVWARRTNSFTSWTSRGECFKISSELTNLLLHGMTEEGRWTRRIRLSAERQKMEKAANLIRKVHGDF